MPGVALAALHIAVALGYRLSGSIAIESDPRRGSWDWHWQTLPLADLRADLAESLWYLHAQPPGYNLLGGLLAKLLSDANVPLALWVLNVVLGGVGVALAVDIIRGATGSRWCATITGVVLALHPTLLLYEAYPLYTHLAAMLCVVAVWCVHAFVTTRRESALVGFAATAIALILVRSAFHIALIVPLLAALAFLSQRRRTVVMATLLCILPVAVCVKNQALYGVMGTSSWAGQGLWRIASASSSRADLSTLASTGVIDTVPARFAAFTPPAELRESGYGKTSDIVILARDDQHNINVPDIGRTYMRSALALIAADPLAYLRNVERAYAQFCEPSSRFKHVRDGRQGLGVHETVYSDGLYGASWVGYRRGSLVYFVIPLSLLIYLIAAGTACGRRPERWVAWARRDAPVAIAGALVAYIALVGSAFEYGENARFKALVEPTFIIFIAIVTQRSVTRGWDRVTNRAVIERDDASPGRLQER